MTEQEMKERKEKVEQRESNIRCTVVGEYVNIYFDLKAMGYTTSEIATMLNQSVNVMTATIKDILNTLTKK